MIVVDTNVIAHLWLPGDMTPAVEHLMTADADWAVPLLWRSEFRSVLAGVVKRKACSLERAIAVARAAEDQFRGREFSVESAHVLNLTAASGCSAYDCEFVALAEDLGVSLITYDREILRAFPKLSVSPDAYS